MSKRLGYVRVSTVDQNVDRQLEGIELDKKFIDRVSGKSVDRPQLHAMLDYCRESDVIYVHSLDRLGRNLDDLRKLVSDLTEKGVEIHFMKESLVFKKDSDAMSQLLLSVMGAFAEFERNLILERQREGIAIAKAKGVYKGRKPKLTAEFSEKIIGLVNKGMPIAAVARELNICRHTVYKALREAA